MRCCCRTTTLRSPPCCAARCSVSAIRTCSTSLRDRGRKTLRAALAAHSGEPFADGERAARNAGAYAARRATPFAFFAHVLGADGGRRRFLARLGLEANDALDEFLNLALDYERHEAPSLQGFLAWLREARAEIKRDMEIERDEVRVMTVHGAKGLEAPIVILADTITPPAGTAAAARCSSWPTVR